MRIAEDRGGQIGHYLQTYAALRSSGENVVIDGNCLSACTMVLGLIPPSRICATSRARFGFHAAWMPNVEGEPVTSPMGTQALWNVYPKQVRNWIRRHGGLSRKMIYLQGREMRGIVSACGEKTREVRTRTHTRSARHYAGGRSVRFSRAAAANDRR
jgi:hypothetical protein